MAHVGLYVKTDTGYSFFEVNGMDRNLKAGNKCQDYDNSVGNYSPQKIYKKLTLPTVYRNSNVIEF